MDNGPDRNDDMFNVAAARFNIQTRYYRFIGYNPVLGEPALSSSFKLTIKVSCKFMFSSRYHLSAVSHQSETKKTQSDVGPLGQRD